MGKYKQILDSMNTAGVLVVEKESRTIKYCNPRLRELIPNAEVGKKCYETGFDICDQCPLKNLGEAEGDRNVFIRESDQCEGPVEITVDEVFWENKTPAYLLTLIPQVSSQETKDYYMFNRAMNVVVNEICEAAVCCNLTKNTYRHFTWNEDGNFVCVGNGCADELFDEFFEKIHPQDRRRLRRIDNARKLESYFRNGGRRMKEELRIDNGSGRYHWISGRILPLPKMSGSDILAVLVVRDIHTRRTLQEQMQHNLATTYKAIPGGVCTVLLDKQLTIISANEEFYNMLDKREEDYANGYLEHIHPLDVSRVMEYIRDKGSRKENIEITYRVFDNGGKIRWLQVRGLEYGESNGYPIYLMLRTDITQVIEAQMQVEREQERYRTYADNMMDALGNLVEFRDVDSGEHIKRTKELTRILMESYNKKFPDKVFPPQQMEKISSAAALHDVGKIAISDMILNKPGRLTADEMDIMKTHTIKGYEILKTLKLDDDQERQKYSLDIAKYHHERWDGNGYPEQLQGDEIPIWSQIVSIVDVYDALVSPRVYKKEFSHEKALEMILNGECGQFNPALLECLKDSAQLLKKQYI